jgi:hypothetical protein
VQGREKREGLLALMFNHNLRDGELRRRFQSELNKASPKAVTALQQHYCGEW